MNETTPQPERATSRDHRIMSEARGAIVRHTASGMIGHLYPWDQLPDGYKIVHDYRV